MKALSWLTCGTWIIVISILLQWHARFHIIIGGIALIAALIAIAWWRRRGTPADIHSEPTVDESTCFFVLRGAAYGLGLLLYLGLVFWSCEQTPLYGMFWPCEEIRDRIDLLVETGVWEKAIAEIDRELGTRGLPAECKESLARQQVTALLSWTDELPISQRGDKLAKAARTAQEFNLELERQLAETRARLVALQTEPRPLPPGTSCTIRQVTTAFNALSVVYFSVEDSSGNPTLGLAEKDLRLHEDSVLINDFQLSQCLSVKEPLYVAICVDRSGSMKRTLTKVRDGVERFVHALAPGDQAECIAFGNDVQRLVGWTQDRAALSSSVGGIQAMGNTALYDAIAMAGADLRPHNGKKAIVLVTDGADTGSKRTFEETIQTVMSAGVPVFAIGIESPELDRDILEQITHVTGGHYLEAAQSDGIGQLYEVVAGTLENVYRLVYQSRQAADAQYTLTMVVGAGDSVQAQRTFCR